MCDSEPNTKTYVHADESPKNFQVFGRLDSFFFVGVGDRQKYGRMHFSLGLSRIVLFAADWQKKKKIAMEGGSERD